jgi:hypothetical protein
MDPLFRRVAYGDLLATYPKACTRWADVRDLGPDLEWYGWPQTFVGARTTT